MMSGSERCVQSRGNIGANSIFAMEIHFTQVWKAQAKALCTVLNVLNNNYNNCDDNNNCDKSSFAVIL